jgi:hypothetical protein
MIILKSSDIKTAVKCVLYKSNEKYIKTLSVF